MGYMKAEHSGWGNGRLNTVGSNTEDRFVCIADVEEVAVYITIVTISLFLSKYIYISEVAD